MSDLLHYQSLPLFRTNAQYGIILHFKYASANIIHANVINPKFRVCICKTWLYEVIWDWGYSFFCIFSGAEQLPSRQHWLDDYKTKDNWFGV